MIDDASPERPAAPAGSSSGAKSADALVRLRLVHDADRPAPPPVRPRFEDLPPAAQRALKEAEDRRRAAEADRAAAPAPAELNGRPGPEPVRYGDWEVKGLASDF